VLLLQESVALIVKVSVTTQPLVLFVLVTLIVGVAQLSVVFTSAATLDTVGREAGLQPRGWAVVGKPEITGMTASVVQV